MGADPRRGEHPTEFGIEGRLVSSDESFEVGSSSVNLPHWTDPPTGDIPRVIAELSSDPPMWMSARRKALEADAWLDQWDSGGAGERGDDAPLGGVGMDDEAPPKVAKSLRVPNLRAPDGRSANPPLEADAYSGRVQSARVQLGSQVGNGESQEESPKESSMRARSRDQAGSRARHSRMKNDPGKLRNTRVAGSKRSRNRDLDAEGSDSIGAERAPSGRSATKATLTGAALGGVVVLAAAIGPSVMLALVSIAVVLALLEFIDLAQRNELKPVGVVAIIATLVAVLGSYSRGYESIVVAGVLAVVFSMVWYLAGLGKGKAIFGISATVLGFLWIGGLGSFAGLILAPSGPFGVHGAGLLLSILICTSASDVLAYAGGSLLGRRKLAPSVSPSKTLEGLLIGAVGTVLAGTFIAGNIHPLTMGRGLELGLVVAIAAPLGDLAESLLKRDLGAKDSGSILPGHGGILDRIDGVLFALPAAYFLLRLIHV